MISIAEDWPGTSFGALELRAVQLVDGHEIRMRGFGYSAETDSLVVLILLHGPTRPISYGLGSVSSELISRDDDGDPIVFGEHSATPGHGLSEADVVVSTPPSGGTRLFAARLRLDDGEEGEFRIRAHQHRTVDGYVWFSLDLTDGRSLDVATVPQQIVVDVREQAESPAP